MSLTRWPRSGAPHRHGSDDAMKNMATWGLIPRSLLLAAACWIVAVWLLPTLAFRNGDSITRAAIDTERKLFLYQLSGRPEALRQWLTAYHGEAPSHQVMISLGQWSLRHPQQFRALVVGLGPKQQARFAHHLAFALSDSGHDDAFTRTFRGDRSPVVAAILRQLRDNP
jgi:hypothetical protein